MLTTKHPLQFLFLMLSVLIIFLSIATLAAAQDTEKNRNPFRNIAYIEPIRVLVPTVVEVSLSGLSLEHKDFLVYENETKSYIGNTLVEKTLFIPVVGTTTATGGVRNLLTDNNHETSVDFEITADGSGQASVYLSSSEDILSNSITLNLSQYSTPPSHIEILTRDNRGNSRVVVAKKAITTPVITFPATTADYWEINFDYTQPFRLTEVVLQQNNPDKEVAQKLRFLAQPNMSYFIFANPDFDIQVTLVESGNLAQVNDVLELPVSFTPNPDYVEADSDKDGITDSVDNCPNHHNPQQEDLDNNRVGDVCDDFDKDVVINSKDNCPNIPNRNQKDEDGDGVGDECDDDESRLTEKYFWIPWVGIGFAGTILVLLFAIVAVRRPDVATQDSQKSV